MPIAPGLIMYAEVILHGRIASAGSDSKNTTNVFHYRRTVTGNPLSKVVLDNSFQSDVIPNIANALNARWTQTGNSIRWIDDATDGPIMYPHSSPGMIVGDSMPMMNTVYLLLRTNLRGRHYRGNKKFGPLSESDTTSLTDDILNTAAIARWTTLATGLMTGLPDGSGGVWVPVVISKTLSQMIVNPTTIVGNDVVAVNLNKRIGRLKRREAKSVY